MKPAPTDYRPKSDLVKHSGGNPRPLRLGVRKVREGGGFQGSLLGFPSIKACFYGFIFEGFFPWCL